MAEDPTTLPPVEPQAGDTEVPQPQAGENTPPEPQAGDGKETSTETISLEEAKKLRSEAANLRKRLKEIDTINSELKQFKEQIETEKLSQTEKEAAAKQKLEKQVAEKQAELDKAILQIQEQKVNQDIYTKAAKVGINPTLAVKVLDHAEIDYDDNGNPTNVEDLLKSLLKEFPNLAANTRQGALSGGATNPGRAQTANAGQTLSWEIIGKMNADEYHARRSEITQWMTKNMRR